MGALLVIIPTVAYLAMIFWPRSVEKEEYFTMSDDD